MCDGEFLYFCDFSQDAVCYIDTGVFVQPLKPFDVHCPKKEPLRRFLLWRLNMKEAMIIL